MNSMESTTSPDTPTTILLFGDQTDSWVEGIDLVYKASSSKPWLKSYLSSLADAFNAEIKATTMDRKLRDSIGHFSSLQELGDKYRHHTDELGVVKALLLHTVRSSILLQWVKREPHLLGPHSKTEWLGISAGLINLSALAVADNFDSLYDACLEVGKMLVRTSRVTSMKTRALEDKPGVFGWAVLGIAADELRKSLDQFQQVSGIPAMKRAQVAVTGPGWNTLIGPPSVLEHIINHCPAVKDLAKNPLEIHALLHILSVTKADLDYIIGDEPIFKKSLSYPNQYLWGMDDSESYYASWGDMLRAVCSQVLSRPLDIPRVVSNLSNKLRGVDSVRVIQIGSSSHASYVANCLKPGRIDVSIRDERFIFDADGQLASQLPSGAIAIVGMAAHAPGSDDIDEFWEHIMSKHDLCKEIPKERFTIDDYYCTKHGQDGRRCTMTGRWGCFINNPGHFDNRFFHISPREAMLMDPGQRQFLMCTYEALEMAGYSDGQSRLTDPNRIATFYGQGSDDWHETSHRVLGCDAYTLQGVQRAFGPGRVAWQFKWEGPTYAIDSACASTTSSIHLACMSLLSRDIDMAVTGAGNVMNNPHFFTCLSKAGILSDTGNCKTYRDDADGYTRGDFVGAVVLKRLEDAVSHNDNILAVVSASGRNHSGNSTSITTSDAAAQERLFRKVMRNAQISPDDISYVEMHGTGTQIGDPAEFGAVASVFQHRRSKETLKIGGVKANFGHSEAAAGMAALLKSIMMFKNNLIPPQAGMPHALNPRFPPLSELNIEILSEPKQYEKQTGKPRIILLNNFDAAGGNACMLLEDFTSANVQHETTDPRSSHVVATSARTKAAYHENKRRLAEWLRANPTTNVKDLAYTTTARRMHHPYRFSCTASSLSDIINKLEAPDEALSAPHATPIVFIFTGQGADYAGMGAELYRTSPVFRDTVDTCADIAKTNMFPAFIDLIIDQRADMSTKNAAQVQLAVITLEMALTAFWRSAGIEPTMVMGHSLGEYAALFASGVLSLADTLYLVGKRAMLLLERCESGSCAMLSVSTGVATVKDHLTRLQDSSCSVACINSLNATVVSGTNEDLLQLEASISAQNAKIRTKRLSMPFAFHSFQIDSILEDYTSIAGGVTYLPPQIPVASTLLASIVDEAGVFNQDYLAHQARQMVDFVGALNAVKSRLDELPLWLEIGPAAVCTSFVHATLAPPPTKIIHSLDADAPNWISISKSLSTAYMSGVPIDWLALHKPFEKNLTLVTLPTYAWDLKEFWLPWTEPDTNAISEKPQTDTKPFVATCAQYLVQASSSPGIQVSFRASISDAGFLALIDGHKMQGIALASGSVFCDAALTAAKYALEYSGRNVSTPSLTLHKPQLLVPLTKKLVGLDGQFFTSAVMDDPSSNTILVSFKATSANVSYDLGSIQVRLRDPQKAQNEWDKISFFIEAKMMERIRGCKNGSGHIMQPEIFYALFVNAVEFSPSFKGIQEAYIASDFQEAAAIVVLQNDPQGTQFTCSPYWTESLAHLAGFMVNGNPSRSPNTTYIVMGFETSEQTVPFESGQKYLVYTRISRWEQDTAFCDVFAFHADSSKMVMQCINLRYQELPRAAWRHVLEGAHEGTNVANTDQRATPRAIEQVGTLEKPKLSSLSHESTEIQHPKDKAQTQDSGVFELIISAIGNATGSDHSEFIDEAMVSELGVDSIMAIEIVATVKAQAGIDLPAAFVFEYPKVGDLRRAFGHSAPKKAQNLDAVKNQYKFEPSTPESSDAGQLSAPESVSSLSSSIVRIEKDIGTPTRIQDNDNSPDPSVRITLLQGRRNSGKTPLYMMADGTGSIATYIHLPPFKSKMPVYGIDSPFVRCPQKLTLRVGIEGVAKLIVDALVKSQPTGSMLIGGFSAGCMVAYEVSRQLGALGRKVDGLLLIDMCCPRPTTLDENAIREEAKIGVAMFESAVARDGLWSSAATTQQHLTAYFMAMRLYNPPPMTKKERPHKAAVVWAELGVVNRISDDPKLMKMLADEGIPIEPYPGYMEDPKLSPSSCIFPNKTEMDLGPNGWDRFAGPMLALSVKADHPDLPMPGHVQLLHDRMEKAISYFSS